MKKKLFLAVFIGLIGTSVQAQVDRSKRPEASEERMINISDPAVFKMENGLTVILVEDHNTPKVSYNLTVDVPVFSERQLGGVGVRDLAGEMMNSGTKSLTKDQLDKKVDLLGASFNASSSGFFASSLKKHSEELLRIAADVLLNPAFPAEELERNKKQFKSSIESSKNDPGSMAGNVSSVANYGKNHPYGEVMTEQDIDNLTLDHVKMYYNTFFKPNLSYLVVVGDITMDELKARVDKILGSWKQGNVPQIPVAKVEAPQNTRVYFAPKKGAVQSEIRVTFPVDIKPGAEDEMAAKLMNSVLGGGVFSGRLMMNLREDKAYTYGCRSSISSDEEMGSFTTFGSFRNEVTDSAITEILGEVKGMISNEITDREIKLAKQGMKGSFIRGLENPSTIAYLALRRIKYNLPDDYYKTYLQRLDKISKEDLKAMANKYLKPNAANIVVVGNEEIAEKLVQFDSQGKLIQMDFKGDEIKGLKPIPEGVEASAVIADFIAKRFGTNDAKALAKIRKKTKSLYIEYEMAVPQAPQPLTIKNYMEKPNKFVKMTGMGSMHLNKTYFDGEKGGSYGMQANVDFTAEEIAEFKSSNSIFEDIDLLSDEKYKKELLGIEEVNGKDAYKMDLVDESGNKQTLYFDIESKMKVKSEMEEGMGENKSFTESLVLEWKEVDGIMYQSIIEIQFSGMTIKQTLKKAEVNVKVDQGLYSH